MKKDRFHMNKSQRMQLKAFICVLGVLLIVILLAGKLAGALLHREEQPPAEPEIPSGEVHIPVVETIHNIWIMEEDEEGILVFCDGERVRFGWGKSGEEEPFFRPAESVREQVADVTLTDGLVTGILLKSEKINGRILSADEEGVEVEGYGRIPLTAECRGYRLYDSLEMCTVRDIRIGYDFADLCLENGEICGILLAKEEAMEYIRVLIKATDYTGLLHAAPVLTSDTDFTLIYGSYEDRKTETHQAGEEIVFSYDSPYFEGGRVLVAPDVLTGKVILKNVNRSQGTPSYRGKMELLRTEEGIAVINEVLLEEYLYSVVPSEMPAGYPAEALKAQAICARTYAYGHMEHAGYPQYGAHVDDSTSYQVYNNIQEQESTTTAVKETYGQLLYTAEGELTGTYYYSTSCGVGSDANVWKTEAAARITYLHGRSLSRAAMAEALSAEAAGKGGSALPGGDALSGENTLSGETVYLGDALREEAAFAEFITSKNPDDFEVNESWYRWSYTVKKLDTRHMLETLQKRYAANSALVLTLRDGEYVSEEIRSLGEVHDIYIAKRGAGGVADELVIEAEEGTYKVLSEHNIRYVLNDGKSPVLRQDGKEVVNASLLPSGFFIISTGKEEGNVVGYSLSGGGFGHGVGMSQNGAKEMAKQGWTAGDILMYFYENCATKCIYSRE
ncbi:MAG: SpoIID/LytB domain-containing protein [Butyrivibrio sp.]|nr:SpoIID/LytB domain-containing protein [Acetatifactor muris]MCM1558476.1 SpoIID/LytB domain-containing protein [Butyrivibrio sp.]